MSTTRDFREFDRRGMIMPPEDKDSALFPRRFDGRWLLIHRPVPAAGRAHIWVSWSPDLRHWGDHSILLERRHGAWWDALKVGLAGPPIETAEGWLIMYHGVRTTASGALYRVGLALLDLENPLKVILRGDEYVMGPEEQYEMIGDVGGVVFPCGHTIGDDGDTVHFYYGAADTSVCVASGSLQRDGQLAEGPRPARGNPIRLMAAGTGQLPAVSSYNYTTTAAIMVLPLYGGWGSIPSCLVSAARVECHKHSRQWLAAISRLRHKRRHWMGSRGSILSLILVATMMSVLAGMAPAAAQGTLAAAAGTRPAAAALIVPADLPAGQVDDKGWGEPTKVDEKSVRVARAGKDAWLRAKPWWTGSARPAEGQYWLIEVSYKDTAKEPIVFSAFGNVAKYGGRSELHRFGGLQ